MNISFFITVAPLVKYVIIKNIKHTFITGFLGTIFKPR